MQDLREKVLEIAGPITGSYGFDLVDAEYVREGNEWYLRIFIDKTGGITIDDCQLVSEKMNKLLDETNLIKGSYIFEVSSPGIDRPLRTPSDFERYKGQEVLVVMMEPAEGLSEYKGDVAGYGDGVVKVSLKESKKVKKKSKTGDIGINKENDSNEGQNFNKEEKESVGIIELDFNKIKTIKRTVRFDRH